MLKVLIADDHAIVRKGLKEILRERPGATEIGEAGDGQSVLTMVDQEGWDILVLDISMPRLNGLEVLRRIRLMRPDLPVLMLSSVEMSRTVRPSSVRATTRVPSGGPRPLAAARRITPLMS